MSLPYSYDRTPDGSYEFTTVNGNRYLLYFTETRLIDADDNSHIVFNVGFSRDGIYLNEAFTKRYDVRIRKTITSIIHSLFEADDHRIMVYFCFGDDGYSRHRNIAFNQWFRDLDFSIEKQEVTLSYEDSVIYGSIAIAKDNPLKPLIIEAFNDYLEDIADKDQD